MNQSPVRYPNSQEEILFLGRPMSVMISGKETQDRYAVLQSTEQKGEGPPRHIHHQEDEVFNVIRGELTVYLGDQSFSATEGATVFLPRGISHTFRIDSEEATIQVVSCPAHFEYYARELSASEMQSYTKEQWLKKMVEVGKRYQIEFPDI
ncbi:cupin domain-containing protein [Hazenella coriacea]|uniref:Cupin domain n=1 Tax=Hazenella coriacea TaxID=1179467 RepID=A0A4R3L9D3_9BACL|nr:cupin domain-containing protein [Hazenella coriacea]TCS94834.1 cupin domain [Hazenella coriacea]